MSRGKGKNRIIIRDRAKMILTENKPMTVRQVFYQLVSQGIIDNTEKKYKTVIDELSQMRLEGIIPFEWIEDRTRIPDVVSMWNDLNDFIDTVLRVYRRDVWSNQEKLIEVWVEKQALSGIFANITRAYGVTLNIGRGYDGWSSIYEATKRYERQENEVVILYFGDFDPSGIDISRSLKERLYQIGARPKVKRIALNIEQVKRFKLPPVPTKKKDARSNGFIDKYGDMAVELDALPIDELRKLIVKSIESYMDLKALDDIKEIQEQEKKHLASLLQ